ncbi:MAG: DUF4918 family protein [Phaeodactylibacter sp.]|nr:DUF4918 family protein [Phaeodactylibacter sp.]
MGAKPQRPMTTFANQVIHYKLGLRPDWQLPPGFELLYPFNEPETQRVTTAFYEKYYSDTNPRIFLFSINPGRKGSGITGCAFTDPYHLAENCGISNDFPKRKELSSEFIYQMIDELGGPEVFYRSYYFISVCPLGFVREGKNINYYDDKALQEAVEPYILQNIHAQSQFGTSPKVAVCVGRGKNLTYLQKLNEKHGFFEELLVVPHPRWVMQYRRKRMDEFIREYRIVLEAAQKRAAF